MLEYTNHGADRKHEEYVYNEPIVQAILNTDKLALFKKEPLDYDILIAPKGDIPELDIFKYIDRLKAENGTVKGLWESMVRNCEEIIYIEKLSGKWQAYSGDVEKEAIFRKFLKRLVDRELEDLTVDNFELI